MGFLYICSHLFGLIIFFSLGKVNKTVDYLLLLLFIFDCIWLLFVFFRNFKIKNVLFHE